MAEVLDMDSAKASEEYAKSLERIRDFLTACYYLAQANHMTVGELYDAFCEGKKETGALIGRKLDELLASQREADSETSDEASRPETD